MSYDVSIGEESFNYTWNLYEFFTDHIEGDENGSGINALMDKTGAEAFILLRDAINKISWTYADLGNEGIQTRYNSSNGWGSVIGAITFLSRIMAACAVYPDEVVRVS